jgi:hypothetical protein
LAVGKFKCRNEGVLLTPFVAQRNLQRLGAFTRTFESEMKDDRSWQWIPNFFIRICQSLYDLK